MLIHIIVRSVEEEEEEEEVQALSGMLSVCKVWIQTFWLKTWVTVSVSSQFVLLLYCYSGCTSPRPLWRQRLVCPHYLRSVWHPSKVNWLESMSCEGYSSPWAALHCWIIASIKPSTWSGGKGKGNTTICKIYVIKIWHHSTDNEWAVTLLTHRMSSCTPGRLKFLLLNSLISEKKDVYSCLYPVYIKTRLGISADNEYQSSSDSRTTVTTNLQSVCLTDCVIEILLI